MDRDEIQQLQVGLPPWPDAEEPSVQRLRLIAAAEDAEWAGGVHATGVKLPTLAGVDADGDHADVRHGGLQRGLVALGEGGVRLSAGDGGEDDANRSTLQKVLEVSSLETYTKDQQHQELQLGHHLYKDQQYS